MTIAALNRTTGIPLRYSNRHGLITGQTGTGKTVTLQKLAESFSAQGVPVFIADVKGDIAALKRSCPVTFYDVFGDSGNHLQTTISAMGADLLGRALELSDSQAGTLEIAFAVAAQNQIALNTINDLRQVLMVLRDKPVLAERLGRTSGASIGVIMRALLRLEGQGGKQFFGKPAFDVARLLDSSTFAMNLVAGDSSRELDRWQQGTVSILKADRLINSPRVYGAFLLWLLSDLYERLPEIGDIAKPRLVFFFDESHLLFTDANPALLRKIEQIVRLIRSKGVGVYFVSQSPNDIPQLIREQLAHRVEHDRALPVGTARFATMTAQGKPQAPVTVAVGLPAAPLGALMQEELPAPRPADRKPVPGKLTRIEIALILLAGVGVIAAGFGGMWLWHSAYFNITIGFFGALVFIGLTKR